MNVRRRQSLDQRRVLRTRLRRLQSTAPITAIQVQGWVRTRRDSKDFSFIELNDGSSLRNLQIIAKNSLPNYAAVQRLTTGASITSDWRAGRFAG